ncbi:MAG: SufD family Fe-S cluster assembly protein [Nitrosopumilus sp.]|nr:SufD family Fe-S cluster assembly protein [Nitrosopumilus sp.]
MQTLAGLDSSHVRAVSEGEPDWLASFRQEALERYESLPVEVSPLYTKYTDAGRLDPAMVALPGGGAGGDGGGMPAFLKGRLGELAGEARMVQAGPGANDVDVPSDLGIRVVPIMEAASSMPDVLRGALESIRPTPDRFSALCCAAFSSGSLVVIPEGVRVERPVHLVECLPGGASSISLTVVSAGASSSATVVQEAYSADSDGQARIGLFCGDVGGNARLGVTTLQMMGAKSADFSTRVSRLAAGARVDWYTGLFGASMSRYRTEYRLAGEGASAADSEVAFGSGSQTFDVQADLRHDAPATEGRVVEKSILRGSSRSLFKGMIRINEGASKSNSFLSGRSILLDPEAKSDAIPGLEILTNDVKATHSASVAQIDEEQIFYLASRCLSRAEAERTIVEGFLEPLSRRMPVRVRAWIAHLVESKWEGRQLSINTDEELERLVEVEETRYNEDAEIEQHYKYR